MPNSWFYAVARGHRVGIFRTWAEAAPLVAGYSDPKCHKFKTKQEAEAFIREHNLNAARALAEDPDALDFSSLSLSDTKRRISIPSKHEDAILAFCASSVLNHQGEDESRLAGFACLFPIQEETRTSTVEGLATNQRADFLAAIEALRFADELDPKREKVLYVYTNNLNLVSTMTKWIEDWQRSNWRNRKNRDLLMQLYERTRHATPSSRPVKWRHVKTDIAEQNWKTQWLEEARGEAGRVSPLAASA